MGFLKKAFNRATGRSAVVTVEPDDGKVGHPVTVTGEVSIKDEPLVTTGITIEIRLRHESKPIDYDLTDGQTPAPIWNTVVTHEEEVAGAQTLDAGSNHSFSATFEPVTISTTHGGLGVESYIWQARMVVTADGNDPDSGWTDFYIADAD